MTIYADAFQTEPREIVRPDTYEAVQKAVSDAAEAGRSVIPWGGGTAQTYGFLPDRVDVLLDLSNLNRVLAHEPGDLTVTVEAGATLETVQNALAQKNQFLPLDPAHAKAATMGGIIATNAWGPGRTGYGTVRDWLIGLTVVDAQGRLVKGGGKVVKNVTGYDTPKLHVGALGTLGVIVEATFKIAPRPEAARSLLFVLSPGANTGGFLSRLHRETAPLFAVLQTEADTPMLALLYAGYEAVVEHEAENAARIARDFGAMEPVSTLPSGVGHPLGANESAISAAPLIAQFAGRPAHAEHQHETLHTLFGASARRIVTHPFVGHTVVTLRSEADGESTARQMGQWAEETHTPLAFLHAPPVLRRRDAGFPLWSPLPPALPLMQKLKQTLDPQNTLNPGRFVV